VEEDLRAEEVHPAAGNANNSFELITFEICHVDLFIPNKEKGKPPVVLYTGEYWHCSCCVVVCPSEGAITLRHPLMSQVHWVEKSNLLKYQGRACLIY